MSAERVHSDAFPDETGTRVVKGGQARDLLVVFVYFNLVAAFAALFVVSPILMFAAAFGGPELLQDTIGLPWEIFLIFGIVCIFLVWNRWIRLAAAISLAPVAFALYLDSVFLPKL